MLDCVNSFLKNGVVLKAERTVTHINKCRDAPTLPLSAPKKKEICPVSGNWRCQAENIGFVSYFSNS